MSIYSSLQDYSNLIEKFLVGKQEALQQAQTKYLQKRGYSKEEIENPTSDVLFDLLILEGTYPSMYEEEDDDDDVEDMFGYSHSINHSFPSYFRTSLFITAYSIFETRLQDRCQYIHKDYEFKLSVSDIKGRGIIRSKIYLEKVVGFDISVSKDWSNVVSYGKLRNCLVHNNGLVDGSQEEKFLRDYISKHKFLTLDHNKILLLQGFCEETIETFERFDDFIFQCIQDWIRDRYSSSPQ